MLVINLVEELTAATPSTYPLARFERRAMSRLRDLAQQQVSSIPGLTAAALDPGSFITDQMVNDFINLAIDLWNDLEDESEGFGLDTTPFDTFKDMISDSIDDAKNAWIDTIKSLIQDAAEGNVDAFGEFFFAPDYVPGTGLKPSAPYVVQFGEIRDVLGRLGGHSPDAESQLTTGMTGGSLYNDILAANGVSTNDKLWLYGETVRRTFNGHLQMDGLVFQNWDDPALEISPQDYWLRTNYYRPGDHWGCACVVVPYVPNFGEAFNRDITATVAAATEVIEFYNPNQARDKNGRWWKGTSIASTSKADQKATQKVLRKSDASVETIEFACYDASCRPPTSGGTGGSSPKRGHLSITNDWTEEQKLLDSGPRGNAGGSSGSTWHGLGITPTDIYNGFESFKGPNGEIASVTVVVPGPGGKSARVEGVLLDSNGKRIGEFIRKYRQGDKGVEVHHESLDISPDHQGKGLGGAFLKHTAEHYRSQGVKAITVVAASGTDITGKKYNGSYTWARLGFKLRPNRDYNDQWKRKAALVIGHDVRSWDRLTLQDVLNDPRGVEWLKSGDGEATWEGMMEL